MRLSARGKLFGASVLMILVTGLAGTFFFETQLVGWMTERIESRLSAHAHSAQEFVERVPNLDSVESSDPVIDRFAEAIQARVTYIRRDGSVLGDSSIETSRVPDMGNHAERPEVVAAMKEGLGISRRFSDTTLHETLYVAVPFERTDGDGVIRVSLTLEEVDEVMDALRRVIHYGVLVGLIVAMLMSGLASHLLSRTLRGLAQTARLKRRGEGNDDPEMERDEVQLLALTLDDLSVEVERSVGELAEERARVNSVLEAMKEAIIAVDGDLKVTLVNAAAKEMFDLPRSSEGRTLIDLLRLPELNDYIESGDWRNRGEGLEVQLHGSVERDVLAQVSARTPGMGLVVVCHDITRLRQLEGMRSDFVANVSHELRTPVSAIQGGAENLLDGAMEDPAMSVRFLESIARNAERLGRIISELMDLNRIESGAHGLEPEALSVGPALEGVLQMLKLRAEEKRITFHKEVEGDLRVWADSAALEQILFNLIENAVKYVPEKGNILVRVKEAGDSVLFEIVDDGDGVPTEHHARLFERFYRVDDGRSRAMGGTGLGLAIVKHLVTSMGGHVGVREGERKGSVFHFELPIPS